MNSSELTIQAPDILDNLCVFAESIFKNLTPDEALERYGLTPTIDICGRNLEIVRLREQGLTYKQIGAATGTTHYTAFKVCKEAKS